MKEMKVIQILTHSLSNLFPDYSSEDNRYKFYEGGWHVKLSKQILKISNDPNIECWGMEKIINKPISFEYDGITCRIFPSQYFKFLGELSIPLLKKLNRTTKHQNVIIHLHGVFNYTTFLMSLLFKNVPIIVQQHGDKSSLQGFHENLKENKIKAAAYFSLYLLKQEWFFERMALKNVDYFFVLNEDARTYLSSIVGLEKVEKLSMGVDFDLFKKISKVKARESLGLKVNKKYVLFVGAFVRLKGLDYLLQAFPMVLREHPDSILLLVGDGYYKGNLEMLAKKLGIEKNVIFFPWVENRKLPLYYNAADVTVLSSLSEGLGLVGIEALACETPFVGSKVGGIPDIIKNFRAGALVPPKNPEAIASAITSFLNKENKNFKVDRENARRYYNWESIVKRTVEVYAELWERYYG